MNHILRATKMCWTSGVMLWMAAEPLLGISEVASCGCAVTTGLHGGVVSSPASLSFGSFWFRFVFVVQNMTSL